MEEVISKLSEIETAAKHIMESATAKQQTLTDDLNRQIQDYDRQMDQDTASKVDQIRASLEGKKEEKIAQLEQQTTHFFDSLDQYYQENHRRLIQEVYNKIIQ